jgi:hypothetical protein
MQERDDICSKYCLKRRILQKSLFYNNWAFFRPTLFSILCYIKLSQLTRLLTASAPDINKITQLMNLSHKKGTNKIYQSKKEVEDKVINKLLIDHGLFLRRQSISQPMARVSCKSTSSYNLSQKV